MKNLSDIIPATVSYFFILLFIYASVSKLTDFENFQVQIAQSPILSAYAEVISYAVISIELLTVILLSLPRRRVTGLFFSLALMMCFTAYIYIILHYSDFVPCSCGGILEKMDWNEHLIFNIACVILASIAIILTYYNRQYGRIRIYFKLLAVTAISTSAVVLLFLQSENTLKKANNFTRRFLPHPLIEDKVLELDNEHYYFAGHTKEALFLGNKSTPLLLSSVGNGFTTLKFMRIHPDQTDFNYTNLQLKVRGSHYFLYDGSVPIIYKGTISNPLASTISYNDVYFSQLAIVDSSHFAVRIQSSATGEYELGMLRPYEQPQFKLSPDLLEKQIDGIFDADGQLITDGNGKYIQYVYAYRNQFMIMNERLELKNRFNTIDTISKAQVQPIRLSDGNTKLQSRPLKVNAALAVNGPFLFNRSYLMGKHEPRERWRNASIIDIYRTDRQQYVGSFYMEHIDRKAVSQMMVTDRYLYAIAGSKLIRYQYRTSAVKYFTTGYAENLNKE